MRTRLRALLLGIAVLLGAGLWPGRGVLAISARPAQTAQPGAYLVHADGTGALKLAAGPARLFWAPDDDRFALLQEIEGTAAISVAHAADAGDGLIVFQGADSPVDDVAWSPDGGSLALTSGFALQIVAADGSGPARQIADHVYAFAWAPGSGALAVVQWDGQPGHGESLTTIAASDGAAISHILPGQTKTCPSRLAWSADGAYLAFSAGLFQNPVCGDPAQTAHGLWVWDTAAKALRQLETKDVGLLPRWTADGQIVTVREEDPFARSVVAYAPAGGGQVLAQYFDDCRELSDLGAGAQAGGGAALFLDTSGDLPQIVTLPLAGGDQTDLSPPGAYTALPLLSPDGSAVAYSLAGDGDYADLAIVRTDGTPRAAMAGNGLSLRAESWSADGATLFVTTQPRPLNRCARVDQ
ncbi:MAG TPA: hypothetical protein VKV26_05635 [Dehalococcoidia bacterium]|nr:hypothetical protein [Dehalococcoidia bacterium]